MIEEYICCALCPRKCMVNRYEKRGFCGMGAFPKAGRAMLHEWEEPCISYRNGAGTIFFSGCSLHCVYCQNNYISNGLNGTEITAERLAGIFLELQDRGADNIELVTPTHFVPDIISALDNVRHKINIPVIYNTGGYELAETIRRLDGYIDIYMPDIKYFSPEISAKYSHAPDYFGYASSAVLEMMNQVGSLKYNDDCGLVRGVIIRHLVLPRCYRDSFKILEWIAENTSHENALVSIMSQYTPFDFISDDFPELKRQVSKFEYRKVIEYAEKLGVGDFMQEKTSSDKKYTPEFNSEGIAGE